MFGGDNVSMSTLFGGFDVSMMACVYIPVQNSSEEVRVQLDNLPRDASDILDILKAEQAPLHLWLTFAREYFKQGKIDEFLQILVEGSSPEIDEYYSDVKYDRIAILNALGAYYTNLGKVEQKQREKDEHFISATQYYNRASRIDQDESTTWVGKGQLLLAKGDLEQSFEVFKIVLEGQSNNVPALLGQACVQFNRGRYQDSLNLYKKVLQVHPRCPASVRLGLGICRHRLGQTKKARQAFERVLQLDPENVDAVVALAMLTINTDEPDGVREGLENMRVAYSIYPYSAMALNHLANHFFFIGQHYIVDQLMEAALAATDHAQMKAQSYYNLARSYHTKGDYGNAAAYYRASIKDLKDAREFILPYYGLGQVHFKLGELKTALANFEKVLEVHADSSETVKAIGHIYLQQGQKDRALESFRKATKLNPRDVDAWVEVGELLVARDFGAALEAFKTALSLLRKNGEPIPLALFNNIGVLHFERNELEAAMQAYMEALGEGVWVGVSEGSIPSRDGDTGLPTEISDENKQLQELEENGISLEVPAEKVTILFNLARLHEQLHESHKAMILYQLLLYKHPQYVDAYMRLAAMARERNQMAASLNLVSKVLELSENSADALSVRGALELKADDWLKAKETYKSIQVADGKDSYSTLALGNWNYYAAVRGERKDPKLEATHLEKAKELFQKLLTQKHNNLYAANGIGIVLAEKGIFDVSKEVFTQVQEAAAGNVAVEMPDVWINLAHVYSAQGQFALAIKMYQNCLKRFYHNTDSQILLYLARTHYEAEQWQDCKRVLLRAIHLAPSNYTLRFDVAIAMQKFATATLQKAKRTAEEVRQSVAELKNALRLFNQLSGAGISGQGFDEKKIELHVEYCKHLLDAGKVHLEAAEREEQQNRQKMEVARQLLMAEEDRRKAEEDRKIEMERKLRDEEARKVLREEEKLKHLMANWNVKRNETEGEDGAGEKDRKEKKKKRKKDKKTRSRSRSPSEPEYEEDRAEPAEDVADEEQALAAAGLLGDSEDEREGPGEDMARPAKKKGRLRKGPTAFTESEGEDGGQSQRQRFVVDQSFPDSDVDMDNQERFEDSDVEEVQVDRATKRKGNASRLADTDSE